MGKPLSAEHKAKISAALKARNAAKGKSGRSKTPSKPSGLNGRDSRSMSGADKTKAAEAMYGTGSKQHLAAQKKFGVTPASKPAGKRGPVKSDKTAAEVAADRRSVASSASSWNAKQDAERSARAEKTAKMNAKLTGGGSRSVSSQSMAARINAQTQANMRNRSYRTDTDPLAPRRRRSR